MRGRSVGEALHDLAPLGVGRCGPLRLVGVIVGPVRLGKLGELGRLEVVACLRCPPPSGHAGPVGELRLLVHGGLRGRPVGEALHDLAPLGVGHQRCLQVPPDRRERLEHDLVHARGVDGRRLVGDDRARRRSEKEARRHAPRLDRPPERRVDRGHEPQHGGHVAAPL